MAKRKHKTAANERKPVEIERLADSLMFGSVVAGLVECRDPAEVRKKIISAPDMTPEKADAMMARAREKITLAAVSDMKEEVGRANIQLNDLYKLSLEIGDAKTALATRKEMSKLLRLYDAGNLTVLDETLQSQTEALTREHLENLAITETGLPLDELARVVSLFFVQNFNEALIEQRRNLSAAQAEDASALPSPVLERPGNRSAAGNRKSKKKSARKK